MLLAESASALAGLKVNARISPPEPSSSSSSSSRPQPSLPWHAIVAEEATTAAASAGGQQQQQPRLVLVRAMWARHVAWCHVLTLTWKRSNRDDS